ncbi:GRIN [Lepeophtheirus salmonis]|uniref:GRIN n=1 Tax=Lepeophtheirus salmonis TaxID=72036 RepID=A0A7R8H4I5_LEPSM|nr:GRIN [Lepeophtheirus salmonis]CAF2863109.1 GRIN [Lepeophtheirus salmonis]
MLENGETNLRLTRTFLYPKLNKIYRVGLVLGLPWAYFEFPNGTKTADLSELQKRMIFRYEWWLVRDMETRLNNGTWTGIVSKLVSGEIDICLANLIMTTEREEIGGLDWNPHCGGGCNNTHLDTGEKFSPYSYSNAKHLYPEGGRNFSFGESLWFAVTSLTPQGGGECPKALSGRILVDCLLVIHSTHACHIYIQFGCLPHS